MAFAMLPRPHTVRPRGLRLVTLALLAMAGPARAQIDYRNLDDDRPTLTEDAFPIERHAFEFLLPYRFEREAGAGRLHFLVPELEYGVGRNTQLGVKFPLASRRESGATSTGFAGLTMFGLYNFNTESLTLPALSVRADLHVPIGALAGDQTRITLKAIATRSWGRTRAHLNASWTLGKEDSVAAGDAARRWVYSVAMDRTLFRQSTLLIGELYALRSEKGRPVELSASIGGRYQWTPTTVIDFGLAHRLRKDVGPDLAVTIGLSHVFAFPGLMPGAR